MSLSIGMGSEVQAVNALHYTYTAILLVRFTFGILLSETSESNALREFVERLLLQISVP